MLDESTGFGIQGEGERRIIMKAPGISITDT
jgi:hypothetical protein